MRIYERALRFTLEHPLVLAVFATRADRRLVSLLHAHGFDLLPAMDEGGFIVDYIMPAGSSLERPIASSPTWSRSCARRPKWRAPRGAPACNSAWRRSPKPTPATSRVKLKRNRKRSGDEVIADVRAKIKKRSRCSTSSSRSSCRT